MKQLFYTWGNRFEEAWKMEQPLPDLPQRPDLLHEHLAVEIQCSSLKSVRLQERIDGYAQKNYRDWWLLGNRYGPKKNSHICKNNFVPLTKTKDSIYG